MGDELIVNLEPDHLLGRLALLACAAALIGCGLFAPLAAAPVVGIGGVDAVPSTCGERLACSLRSLGLAVGPVRGPAYLASALAVHISAEPVRELVVHTRHRIRPPVRVAPTRHRSRAA